MGWLIGFDVLKYAYLKLIRGIILFFALAAIFRYFISPLVHQGIYWYMGGEDQYMERIMNLREYLLQKVKEYRAIEYQQQRQQAL
jgi:hypothetical protein